MAIAVSTPTETPVDQQVAQAVQAGLAFDPKRLPPWLFYDAAGSRLFEAITELPEYYLTRTERSILARYADQIVECAAGAPQRNAKPQRHAKPQRVDLRISELGAGSADKTRLLLKAAVAQLGALVYEPVDVSATALLVAQTRIEREIPGVRVAPLAMDYTNGFVLDPTGPAERRLVLYIGSSIGNFEPEESARLLRKVRGQLASGDSLLLGVDLVKDEETLLAAYDDAAGTTAAFNKNILARLNRELAADFDPPAFAHRAVWNPVRSRIEMHLVSRVPQQVRLAALDLDVEFAAGESIHTENSYKYSPGEPERMLAAAGFTPVGSWTDAREWFAVCLGRVE